MTAAATTINAKPAAEKSSKFVSNVTAVGAPRGPIDVTIAATAGNGIPTGVNGQTIMFSPNVNGVAPVRDLAGRDRLGLHQRDRCDGRAIAASAIAAAGTLLAKYAPSECR